MATVKVKDSNDVEKAIRKLRKMLDRAGVLKEVKLRQNYMKPSQVNRHKRMACLKKKQQQSRTFR